MSWCDMRDMRTWAAACLCDKREKREKLWKGDWRHVELRRELCHKKTTRDMLQYMERRSAFKISNMELLSWRLVISCSNGGCC